MLFPQVSKDYLHLVKLLVYLLVFAVRIITVHAYLLWITSYCPHSQVYYINYSHIQMSDIRNHTNSAGVPDWDKISRALLNHRNTPDPEWKLSMAQILFGRPVRDFLPIKMNS